MNYRCKAEFLVQLDGFVQHEDRPVLFLGTTNLPWSIDPGLLRRFQRVVNMDLPDNGAREQILRQNIGTLLPKGLKGLDLGTLITEMEGFSGSDVRTACVNATKKVRLRWPERQCNVE